MDFKDCVGLLVSMARVFLFGHVCRADTSPDHSRALQACIQGPPTGWLSMQNRYTEANLVENG